MNPELLPLSITEVRHNTAEHDQPVDFATIVNPLGHSSLIERLPDAAQNIREQDLHSQIARWLRISEKHMTLSAGSTEIINEIPKLFVPVGRSCVLPTPTYFALTEPLRANGNSAIRVYSSAEDHFAITPEFKNRVTDAIHLNDPALVWLCSPNNPTGSVWDQEDIGKIADMTDGLVVVDEAYQEYNDPENDRSAIRLLGEHRNILVTKTFSKAFGLPEARVGIAIGDPLVIASLRGNRRTSIGQQGMRMASLAVGDPDHVRHSARFVADESRFMEQEIGKLSSIKLGCSPSGGILLVRHATDSLFDRLRDRNIRVEDLNKQEGLEGFGYVRIGLRLRPQNLQLLEILTQIDRESGTQSEQYTRVTDPDSVRQAYELLEPEFISKGGRLRDRSLSDLQQFARHAGQLWVARKNGNAIACCTLEDFQGEKGRWIYINNGVVASELRHQGGFHMPNLVQAALSANRPDAGFIVLSTAHTMFENLRFIPISADQLHGIDEKIGKIARDKIRADDPAQIYIKLS